MSKNQDAPATRGRKGPPINVKLDLRRTGLQISDLEVSASLVHAVRVTTCIHQAMEHLVALRVANEELADEVVYRQLMQALYRADDLAWDVVRHEHTGDCVDTPAERTRKYLCHWRDEHTVELDGSYPAFDELMPQIDPPAKTRKAVRS